MKNRVQYILTSLLVLIVAGCASYPAERSVQEAAQLCLGHSNLPAGLISKFEATEDKRLLNDALGKPDKGKLCQGKVYKTKQNAQVTIFRAWNSTNPNSRFGKWWAFNKPSGKVADYRSSYEICYQWSSLDKLVRCHLKPGVSVVVGTGQSAKCSDYLTYPVSDKQQIYIDKASVSVENCTIFDGEFSWK